MTDCIFCKIARHEFPKEFAYEDEETMAFADINPIKPTHLLIMPKKHIGDFMDLRDNTLLEKIKQVAQKLIKDNKLEDKGYRLVVNGGGAQIIYHLHVHLVGPLGKAVHM